MSGFCRGFGEYTTQLDRELRQRAMERRFARLAADWRRRRLMRRWAAVARRRLKRDPDAGRNVLAKRVSALLCEASRRVPLGGF